MTNVFYNGKYLIMSSHTHQIMCNKHCCDKALLMFFPNVYIQTQPVKKSRKLFKSKCIKVIVALYVTLMVTNCLYRPFLVEICSRKLPNALFIADRNHF